MRLYLCKIEWKDLNGPKRNKLNAFSKRIGPSFINVLSPDHTLRIVPEHTFMHQILQQIFSRPTVLHSQKIPPLFDLFLGDKLFNFEWSLIISA
jgi:hypothetical protein